MIVRNHAEYLKIGITAPHMNDHDLCSVVITAVQKASDLCRWIA